MPLAPPDVQVPVRIGLVPVGMRVRVHAAGGHAPEADAPQPDEQHASEHLAAALHDDRQRPAEHDQRAGAEREEQRVAEGEPHRDAKRARALDRGRLAAGTERQRRDRHQVIGAEAVENAQKECR